MGTATITDMATAVRIHELEKAGRSMPRVLKASPWTVLAWGLVLLSLSALVILSGLSTAIRQRQPSLALRLMPSDAIASAYLADRLLIGAGEDKSALVRANRYARNALTKDPTLVTAWRTLALTRGQKANGDISLLRFSESLSRRDVPTQLALLEWEVQKGDIRRALHHYDVILRISTAYDSLLFPVLAGASSEVEIRRALGDRLAHAPMWRRRFFSYLANSGVPFLSQAEIFEEVGRSGPILDADIAGMQASNAVASGRYPEAKRLSRLAWPGEAQRPLRNGDFEGTEATPPFDWQLDSDGPMNVAIGDAAQGRRLEITTPRGDGGPAARQILYLPAGTHRFHADFGSLEGYELGEPYAWVICAAGSKPLITVEASKGKASLTGAFRVGDNCPVQWVELGMRQNPRGEPTGVWLDSANIR